MPKKSFRDNPALAFIGNQATEESPEPLPPPVQEPPAPPPLTHPPETHLKYYRINLKVRADHRAYLRQASWNRRTSITQYINDLIEADKERNRQ